VDGVEMDEDAGRALQRKPWWTGGTRRTNDVDMDMVHVPQCIGRAIRGALRVQADTWQLATDTRVTMQESTRLLDRVNRPSPVLSLDAAKNGEPRRSEAALSPPAPHMATSHHGCHYCAFADTSTT
jgi:hypothetical protein